MIVVDILSLYSCMSMVRFCRAHKKVYFALKGKGAFSALAIGVLRRFGWEFIQLDYDLGPVDSRTPYVDVQTDLFVLMEEEVAPALEKEIHEWRCFSEYEKRHLSSYMAFRERHCLHQKIELLHVIELLKDRIGRPDLVLLYWSQWKDALSARYAEKGYHAVFYAIHSFPKLKIEHRRNYYHANMVQGIIDRKGSWGLALVLSKIVRDVFASAYAGILKHFRSEMPKRIEEFDICAVIPGFKRTEWFNDLLWKKELMGMGKNYRTLAILHGSFDDSAYDTYGYLAEGWVTLDRAKPSPHLYSAFTWLWPLFPRILIRNMFGFLRDMAAHKVPVDHTARILSFLLEESKMEALFRATGARLFWSSNGLMDLQTVAGIIAIHRLGGVSLGTVWSSYMMSLTALTLHNTDVFFIWGPRHAHIFNKSISRSKVISGYPGDASLGHYLSKARTLREEWDERFGHKTVLCFYDDYFARDDGYSFNETVAYVNHLLQWAIKRPEILFVVKSKRQTVLDGYPSSTLHLLKTLESQERLVYEFENADLAPGFAADIVVGVGLSTLPCLMGTYGKRIISLDCNRYHERWPVGVADITFLERAEEIVEELDALTGEIAARGAAAKRIEIRPAPSRVDSFVDGRSAERISSYIINLIEDLKRGHEPDAAISHADRIFSGRWGSDKIVGADRCNEDELVGAEERHE